MRIEWEQLVPFDSASQATARLSLVADSCQVAEDVLIPCAVHVMLTNDAHIKEINAAHRQIDHATDVLSFPTVNYPQGITARDCTGRLRREIDPDGGGAMLGDIVISLPHAKAQANEYGHSLLRELCYLVAHGLFHLFGYDHLTEQEQKEMRHMEEKALELAGIPREESPHTPNDDQLLALARLAMQHSYSPYSRFKVGAALLASDGRVIQGCNIENASFGLSNCAERTAVFKAVSEGITEFTTIAIAAESAPPYPCGACRQVLNEFAPDIRLLITWGDGNVEEATLPQLLPHSFGPKDLPK